MKDRKGFSLIELLVVIAIIAAVGATASLGLGMLTHQKAKAASKVVFNMLGNSQTLGMSRANCYFVISASDDGTNVAILNKTDSGWTVLEQSDISSSVTIKFKVGATEYTVTKDTTVSNNSKGMVLEVNRSTGAFTSPYQYSGDITNPLGDTPVKISTDFCSNILIIQGGKTYDIGLASVTGKIYYNE